jgi:hypothetical protein
MMRKNQFFQASDILLKQVEIMDPGRNARDDMHGGTRASRDEMRFRTERMVFERVVAALLLISANWFATLLDGGIDD